MKGKFLLSVVALVLPMSMAAQVAKPAAAADAPDAFYRYEAYANIAYSGDNQVKSASALLGINVGVQAKLKRWFGANVDFGDYFAQASDHGIVKPTVTTFLAGPEFYVPADHLTGFIHVLFGGAHTSGGSVTPDVAFTYAVGGGFEYALNKHWSGRIAGDGISSSFVQDADNLGNSPHRRINPRATIGVGYRF